MLDGIAKTFRKDKKVIFVGIQNHCDNLEKIVDTFDDNFTGNQHLLKDAASKHDLWKHATMNPEVIIKGKGNLFWGHGSEFPSHLISEDFDEIEFDEQKRVNNYPNYYTLNLIRLHHSGFSTFNLYSKTDFIYEAERIKGISIKEEMMKFIRDWYALKTADWIDSFLMESVFKAEELPSLIDLGLKSEVDLGKSGEKDYFVIPSNIMKEDLKLVYQYVENDIDKIKQVIGKKSRGDQRSALNDFFLESEKGSVEVFLHGDQ